MNGSFPRRPLHVAQIVPHLDWGGVQELVTLYAETVDPCEVATLAISLGPPSAAPYTGRLKKAGARILHLPARRTLDPLRLVRLRRILREVDLAHAHLPGPNLIAPLAGRLAGAPVLCGLHLEDAPQGPKARLRTILEFRSIRLLSSGAIACGDEIARLHSRRIAPKACDVVSNPAPPMPEAAQYGSDRPPDGVPPRFIVVGRLSSEKGVDLVLDASAHLSRAGIDHRLDILGDGPARSDLETRAAALGLEKVVRFHGARADVARHLHDADIYVSGSRVEGLSIALLEAMACGLPVVATSASGVRGAVDDTSGRVVPRDDVEALAQAMRELGRDRALRARMGAAAAQRARLRSDVASWAARLTAIYRRAAARQRPRAPAT